MKSIFIYGITGDIGQRTARLLNEAGHRVSGVARSEDKARPLIDQGINVVLGDVASASAQTHQAWLEGVDVVLFTAGAKSDDEAKIRAVDYQAVIHSAQAAMHAGVGAYVLVSAFPEAGRRRETTPGFECYMHYKKLADAWLVNSTLAWTILRPGRLTKAEPTGRVQAAPALPYGEIPRADFAAFVADAIRRGAYPQAIVEVTGAV